MLRDRILYEKIREILMDSWDPIGVAKVINAQDEYDSYIPQILEILRKGCTAEEMVAHIRRIEIDTMGLRHNEQRARKTAENLLSVR
jgi:hypothetical protein